MEERKEEGILTKIKIKKYIKEGRKRNKKVKEGRKKEGIKKIGGKKRRRNFNKN